MKGLLFKGAKRRVFAFMAAIALSFSLIGVVPVRRVSATEDWRDTELIVNGDFEIDFNGEGSGWTRDIDWTRFNGDGYDGTWTKSNQNMTNNTTQFFHYSNQADDAGEISLSQIVTITEAGKYKVVFEADGINTEYDIYFKNGDNTISTTHGTIETDWNDWKSKGTLDVDLPAGDIKIILTLDVKKGGWGDIDNVKLLKYYGVYYTATPESNTHQKGTESGATITVDSASTNITSVTVSNDSDYTGTKYTMPASDEQAVITFSAAYLDTLSVGNHTVTVGFADGAQDVESTLIISTKPTHTATVSNSPYTKYDSANAVSVTLENCATTVISGVYLDNATDAIATTNYETSASDTSAVIAFKKDYLNGLTAGEHTVKVTFTEADGADDQTGKFTISVPVHTLNVNVATYAKDDPNAETVKMTVNCATGRISTVAVGQGDPLTLDTDYKLTESGTSTVISFTNTYLTSLKEGDYTATVTFTDGAAAKTGDFTVSVLPTGLQNGDFESTGADYIWNGGFGTQSKLNDNSGTYLNLWTDNKTSETILSQTFIAEKTGTFDISYKVIGDGNSGIAFWVNDEKIGEIEGGSYSWPEVTTTKSFDLKKDDIVKFEIKGTYSGTWAAIDDVQIVEHKDVQEELPVGLQNGDFENAKYWVYPEGAKEPFAIKSVEEKDGNNKSAHILNIWTDDYTNEYAFTQTFKAEKSGQFVLKYKYLGSETCGFSIFVNDTKVDTLTGKGWNGGEWTERTSKTVFELEKDEKVTFSIKGTQLEGKDIYFKLDDISVVEYEEDPNARNFNIDTTIATGDKVDTDLYVEKLDLAKGFITGADISSYASIVASGATYKNAKGEPLSDAKFFELLAESGVNYVRIRVWVDPKNSSGKGYGGGNCDIETAKKLGKLATDAGMKVLIDFHYSDFWTDPGKQTTPKAWQGLTLDEKAEKLFDWTYKSLMAIIKAGVDVGMVQIGNETTTGFCGETKRENMCFLFKSGSDAVRAVEEELYEGKPTIMMAIHLTNPNSVDFSSYAKDLKENGVVYDVFATSFYPYWHGTLDNLYTKLAAVADEYDKYVMVAETSYVRTLEDGDGWENTETQSKKDNGDVFPYDISEQGQVLHIRNVINTLTSIPDNKGIGVFWWEPAWIPVQNWADAEDQDKVLAENKALWEEYGSGWATSAASDYDKNVGQWYGGSAVDNESWFDFDGKALESLKVYNMVRFGTNSEDYLIDVIDTEYSFVEGQEYSFPTEVDALYASGETYKVGVTWDQEQIEAAAASGYGSYEIDGIVTYNEEEYDVICKLTIKPVNLLVNGSFEDGKGEGWDFDLTHTTAGTNEKADGVKEEDSHDGKYTFHFYSTTDQSFTVTQKVTLEPGAYAFNGYFQGLAGVEGEIFVQVGDDEYAAQYVLNGWVDWQNPEVDRIFITEETEVTVGFTCSYSAGAWGTCDDFTLYRMGDIVTISFDSNGHGTAPDPITVLEGEKVNQPADPSAEGFIFTGWCIDKVCTEWFDFNRPIIADNADITLYARWVKNPEKSYYQDGKSEGNIGSLSWILGDGDLHSTYHSTVNDAETINHFKGVDIARYLNDADMAAESGFEAAADAVARGLAPSSAGFTPFAALGGSSLRAKAGSLKLTIFSSYLETLDPGYYLLRIVFDDGEVFTKLTINAKAADDEVEPDDNKAADADVKPADDAGAITNDTAPKTADETPIEAAMLILLISAAGLSYILGLKRKRS